MSGPLTTAADHAGRAVGLLRALVHLPPTHEDYNRTVNDAGAALGAALDSLEVARRQVRAASAVREIHVIHDATFGDDDFPGGDAA